MVGKVIIMPMKLFINNQKKQYLMQIVLLHFFILFITFFATGCNDLSNSDSESNTEAENLINATVSNGAPLPEGTLQDKLFAISKRTDNNVIYDIAINSDASYPPLIVMTQGKNIKVKIHSASSAIRTLTLNSPGSLFNVDGKATLILENIVLKGHPHNNLALISVKNGGTLIIMDGTVIRDNQNENRNEEGGGVYVGDSSKFFMKGGEICYNYCGNRIKYNWGNGGGVYVYSGGYFNMLGGIIHHNETERCGGGVYTNAHHSVYQSTFIMNGGEIASNMALYGGGIYLSGRFIKEPLPNETRSGIIWGYPGNGKENYANGAAIYGGSVVYNNGTIGEYDSINTDLHFGRIYSE